MALITTNSLNGAHFLEFDEDAHKYWLDRKLVPGVTTAIKGGSPESPGLTSWKVGEASKYAVQAVLNEASSGSILTDKLLAQIVKDSKTAYRKSSAEAASVGSLVHDYAYCTENNKYFDDSRILEHPDSQKVLSCIAKFREWRAHNLDQMILAEVCVASVKHQIGGKFDRLIKRGDKTILGDFKTSNRIYIDNWLQLALYRVLIKEWLGVIVDGIEVIRFGKTDEDFEVETITSKKQIKAFEQAAIRAVETYKFYAKHDKR